MVFVFIDVLDTQAIGMCLSVQKLEMQCFIIHPCCLSPEGILPTPLESQILQIPPFPPSRVFLCHGLGQRGRNKTQPLILFSTGNIPYTKQTKTQTQADRVPTQLELQICLVGFLWVFFLNLEFLESPQRHLVPG